MNRLLLLILSITALFASCQTKEDKAKALIEEFITTAIPDNKSYEPIHFDSLEVAKVEYEFTPEYRRNMDSVELYMSKARAYSEVSQAYDKIYRPQEYKRKITRAADYARIAELHLMQIDSLKLIHNENIGGLMMYHRFRYMNPDKGQMDFGNIEFFFDDDVTSIIGVMSLDDENPIYYSSPSAM